MKEEVWRDVPRYEGKYQVSNLGNVRSLDTPPISRRSKGTKGRVLRPGVGSHGYLTVALRKPGEKPYSYPVHHLVLAAFVGPRPENNVIRHLNDDKLDNRLENLCYGTNSENMMDVFRFGRTQKGHLTRQQADLMRELLQAGHRQTTVAFLFGVSQAAVSQIWRKKVHVCDISDT